LSKKRVAEFRDIVKAKIQQKSIKSMTSDRGIEEDLEDTAEGLKRAAKKAKHITEEETQKTKHRIEEAAEEAKDKAD
jgi:hypothetical protein